MPGLFLRWIHARNIKNSAACGFFNSFSGNAIPNTVEYDGNFSKYRIVNIRQYMHGHLMNVRVF